MSETCPAPGDLVEIEINRIATQYREAERLKGYMRAVLGEVEQVGIALCAIPSHFDILTAVGEQLTFIGKRMGFGRCHCVCTPAPVFGFNCGSPFTPIVGFCEGGTWANCAESGNGELCIYDDEVYRAHLLARRYQILGLFDIGSLTSAAVHLWGEAAFVASAGRGRVVVAPGRDLTDDETALLQLSFRVLPVAPGIAPRIHLGDAPIFGFGTGWAGLCEDGVWLCPDDPHPYTCP